MISADIVVTIDTARPAVRALGDALQPQNALPIFGRSVTNTVRAHFDDLEGSRPNKLGGPRTHYYSGARSGTKFVVDGDHVVIGIHQVGIRYRYYGGSIRPGVHPSAYGGQPTKYLTIPASAESYGRRAADFDDLVVLWGKNGPFALARVTEGSVATVGSRGAETGRTEILYWLVQKVEGSADRSILPDGATIRSDVTRDWNRYVRTVWRTRQIPGEGDE